MACLAVVQGCLMYAYNCAQCSFLHQVMRGGMSAAKSDLAPEDLTILERDMEKQARQVRVQRTCTKLHACVWVLMSRCAAGQAAC